MALIFNDCNAAKDRNGGEDQPGEFADDGLVPQANDGPVSAVGASLLAESDGQHLENSAAQRAAKIGVRLDAVDGNNSVCREGGNAEQDFLSVENGADAARFHAGLDGDAEVIRSDAELGKHFRLPFGSGAAVAAHGGHDERLCAGALEQINGRLHNLFQIADAAASNANSNRNARPNLPGNARVGKLLREQARKIQLP